MLVMESWEFRMWWTKVNAISWASKVACKENTLHGLGDKWTRTD
jgi:hypothetical protein